MIQALESWGKFSSSFEPHSSSPSCCCSPALSTPGAETRVRAHHSALSPHIHSPASCGACYIQIWISQKLDHVQAFSCMMSPSVLVMNKQVLQRLALFILKKNKTEIVVQHPEIGQMRPKRGKLYLLNPWATPRSPATNGIWPFFSHANQAH